ncbi:MAG: hypothetical protein JJ975_00135 [Bacteroidia bacterium]|nr:hypothetical protein [Bacteroidia bacterium]
MIPQHILLITLSIGIVLFILSIIFRKKSRLRLILALLGVVIGILPYLTSVAFDQFAFIKERKLVGNYEGDSGVQGMVVLDMYKDNTFVMKSDSCSAGFIQGTWAYSYSKKKVVFESTSQNMGSVQVVNRDTLQFTNIPICIRLARKLVLGKTGKASPMLIEESN